MRLSDLSEEESLESLDLFIQRLRKVTTANLVSDIIENELTETQRDFIREFWYHGKTTSQIAREHGVSQAHAYRTVERANKRIKELMTALIKYQQDLTDVTLSPLNLKELTMISAARNSNTEELCAALKNLRISNAVPAEELADALNISVSELKKTETGQKLPSLTVLLKYSAIFGTEITITIINGRSICKCKKA